MFGSGSRRRKDHKACATLFIGRRKTKRIRGRSLVVVAGRYFLLLINDETENPGSSGNGGCSGNGGFWERTLRWDPEDADAFERDLSF